MGDGGDSGAEEEARRETEELRKEREQKDKEAQLQRLALLRSRQSGGGLGIFSGDNQTLG